MERYSSFAQTNIGESHLKRGLICQDFSLEVNREKYAFAAAADGHGSQCYLRTEKGSRFAAECALECVNEFLESLDQAEEILDNERERGQLLEQLWRSIVSRWHDKTEADFGENPFTEEEFARIPEKYAYYRERYTSGSYIDAYGTTLVFAVVTEDFAFCMQIGDGSCVTISPSGEASEPVPEDPRCQGNVTTSMCQNDAALSARFCYFGKDDIPAAIFLGTDGIENSYWSSEQLHGFYSGLALTFAENGLEEGVRQLAEFLPEMTKKGSGDDVSCAGIIDIEGLKACSDALKAVVGEPSPEANEEKQES